MLYLFLNNIKIYKAEMMVAILAAFYTYSKNWLKTIAFVEIKIVVVGS